MTLKRLVLPRVAEVIPGVFLSRIHVDYEKLAVEDFQSEGLFLPQKLETAVHKRKIEYLLGRLCLKRCFEAFGETPVLVSMGDDRSPIWPEAWVGSISHSKGQVVAVLGSSATYSGLGIDLEALIENPSSALQLQICSDESELGEVRVGLGLTEQQALTLIFSAKESLYKLIFPRYKKFFGFQAARAKRNEKRGEPGPAKTASPIEHGPGSPKERLGTVVSDKADKTITVRIDVARRHRRYQKIVRSSTTLHAHDETNDANIGDVVRIIESRPLSATKRWRLVEVLERAK